MRPLVRILILLCLTTTATAGTHFTGGPQTTDNDSSCDIAVMPAATLLLPYFEVDITSAAGTGENTIFTITNNVNTPQVAYVTLWTDYGYPVITFNIFLTGYDVQSINLFDVTRRGRIAPDDGTGFDVSPVGELSGDYLNEIVFDNPLLSEKSCVDVPVQLPAIFITRMQSAFTTGKVPSAGSTPGCNTAGGVHSHAVGYATIDVVGQCSTLIPTDLAYFTELIRYDNVLSGDYAQINGNEDFAQGNPLVHIRAVPEGGTPQTRAGDPKYEVHSPRTFYSRFQSASRPLSDARQPLPSTFNARWISGGPGGFETFFKIWREGRSTSATGCSALPAATGALRIVELVRFDEEENPEAFAIEPFPDPLMPAVPILPATSLTDVGNEAIYPPAHEDALAGWVYLNLDPAENDAIAGQSWVVVSMRAEDRFSVDFDAVSLGNGCSAPVPQSEAVSEQGSPIGPAPNVRP